jgi:hypothetical protein
LSREYLIINEVFVELDSPGFEHCLITVGIVAQFRVAGDAGESFIHTCGLAVSWRAIASTAALGLMANWFWTHLELI